jgi:hypothetical protein
MKLSLSLWVSASLGIVYGVALRLLMAVDSVLSSGLVSISFFVVVPVAIGYITVFLRARGNSGWVFTLFAPWIAVLGFVATAWLLLLEGMVCVMMALPGFLILSSLGGIFARLVGRSRVPTTATLGCIAILPLVLAPMEKSLPPHPEVGMATTDVIIHASPRVVWSQITNVAPIRKGELSWGLTRLLGVPQPLEAHMELTSSGWVRHTRWDRGVAFREIITTSRETEFLRWSFDFPPSAVPEGVLDDHVRIGGRYFGVIEGGYALEPAANGGTRLTLRTTYRVAARPSLYARGWAYLLMCDFHRVILGLIRDRSERATEHERRAS